MCTKLANPSYTTINERINTNHQYKGFKKHV